MKKILAIICVSLFVISIMASVSEDLTARVQKMTGGDGYSASIVPLPKAPVNKDNLASTKDNQDLTNKK